MTIRTVGYVTFNTHQVHISKDDSSQLIHCFKSTHSRCDYAIFDSEDSASEYILEPFPRLVYQLVLTEDDRSE
jgi:hypothetical protein